MEQNATANLSRKPSMIQGSGTSSGVVTKDLPVVRKIRTMQNDMAEAISIQNETATSIALAEAKKREQQRMLVLAAKQALAESAQLTPKPRHRSLIIFIFLVLLTFTGGLVYKIVATVPLMVSIPLLGQINLGKPISDTPLPVVPTIPVVVLAPALIKPQSEKRFDLSKETIEHLGAVIAVERTVGLATGTIKNFYFFETAAAESKVVSVQAVLNFLQIQMTPGLLRTLDPQFMVGLIGDEGSVAAPFIALKVSDIDIARSELLAGESNFPKSFEILFGAKAGLGLTSSSKFRDEIVAGKDTRILTSASGAVFVYAFSDAHTFYITNSRSALEKLLSRSTTKY